MAHLYIYSPSGAVRNKAGFRRAIKRLEKRGHQVEIDPAALDSQQRFAGDDATRLAAIGRAAASGADVALMTRGGYGLSRILPQLPYKQIVRAIDKGTRFVGLSDFTAMQLALLAHEPHATTWAGNLLIDDWGREDGPDEITEACFDEMLDGSSEGAGWYVKKKEAGRENTLGQSVLIEDATLWGGNLCVLTSLLGTPYFPQIEGGVLFLEEVGEHPYRIERMLSQLLWSGVLERQRAIVIGSCSDYQLVPHDKGYALEAAIQWLRSQCKTPVFTGLPHGHVPTKVLLPVGRQVTLAAEDRDRLLFWGHDHH